MEKRINPKLKKKGLILKQMSKIDWRIIICIIISITIIEIYALSQGINGTILTITIGVLGTIGGVAIPKEKIIKN